MNNKKRKINEMCVKLSKKIIKTIKSNDINNIDNTIKILDDTNNKINTIINEDYFYAQLNVFWRVSTYSVACFCSLSTYRRTSLFLGLYMPRIVGVNSSLTSNTLK